MLATGGVWLGSSSLGVAVWDGREWRYLFGDRFLAGSSILSIAADDEAVVILSTEGIARLRWRRMTLSGKDPRGFGRETFSFGSGQTPRVGAQRKLDSCRA